MHYGSRSLTISKSEVLQIGCSDREGFGSQVFFYLGKYGRLASYGHAGFFASAVWVGVLLALSSSIFQNPCILLPNLIGTVKPTDLSPVAFSHVDEDRP